MGHTDASVRALLRRHAGELLAELAALPPSSGPVSLVASDDALSIALLVTPAAGPGPLLTACERDVLAVLEAATHRLTTGQLLSALELSGRIHGERTVTRALARLRRLDLVLSSRRIPFGYYLPGKSYPLPIPREP